eukprot:COSAG02_NODE_3162_length_7248_cov_147.217793_1_plen_409_part_00
METKDELLVGAEIESEKPDAGGADEKGDYGAEQHATPPAGLAGAHPRAATQIHGALWASCSHTPGVLIGAVVLVVLGLGTLWDAIASSIASNPPPPSPVPRGSNGPGQSGDTTQLGWGWSALSELADLDAALAIVRTDSWAFGQDDKSGVNSLAGQVRFIDLDGREIRPPNGQRVRQLSATWTPDDVVGRHIVLPNSATVTTLLHTFTVTGVAPDQLRWLAGDCKASTSTLRDLAPAYRVESLTPSAAPGQMPLLELAVPDMHRCSDCRDLPMAAFSVISNQGIFQEFRSLAAIPCFHAALEADEGDARAATAHMAYMRANSWATSDIVFVLLCVDGWGGRVVDSVCVRANGGAMDPRTIPPTCSLLQHVEAAWTRLHQDRSQPVPVQHELGMDEDRGSVFSQIEGFG